MAGVEERPRSAIRAADVVEQHDIDIEPVDAAGREHERDAAEALGPEVVGGVARRHEDQALDLPSEEVRDELALAGRVAPGVAEDDAPAVSAATSSTPSAKVP